MPGGREDGFHFVAAVERARQRGRARDEGEVVGGESRPPDW